IGGNIVIAVLTLIIGFWIIGRVVNLVTKALSKNDDPTLNSFLRILVSSLLKVLLLISVASILGVETTSFVAVIGAASFAVGLALQGSLGNFAGGVLIILFRPFKNGDLLEAQGHLGVVKEIQLFTTILTTLDNRTVIIPNGPLAGGSMVNFSTEPLRRVDLTFGIGYNDDIKKAKEVLLKIGQEDERVLKESGKEPFVVVSELGDSSVNFTVRFWCKQEDYWGVYFDTTEKVKLTFDKENIGIPYPHMEVYTHAVSN
ncbi:MAG: mechanosensitive ion channel domain-containing protein, partial [Bacteroidota bacterium]